MLKFLCDVVKDTAEEEYLRPFILIGLDWIVASVLCLQCFDAVGWAAGRASGL